MAISNNSIFYHIYPLGFCGAQEKNDYHSPATSSLLKISDNIEHFKKLGINAVYLGPLFESESHGYNTVDYYHVDRRLGTNDDLRNLINNFHANGISVILDAVFNHSGREFFAFKDIKNNRNNSKYTDWYLNINFSGNNHYNDGFSYEGWAGCLDLVKYNLRNPEIKEHLIQSALQWIREFDIDGLRLDAADVLDFDFMRELSAQCRNEKQDFWLVGEVVHGDYSRWIRYAGLNSVTNYESYKGSWSSFNDNNFFEIAYSLNRQFGQHGIYQQIPMYNFLDNHDVNRIASTLNCSEHLPLVYGLLFTMPGVPSVYYGSEFAIQGKRENGSDKQLRPTLEKLYFSELTEWIAKLIQIRKQTPSLYNGDYKELLVTSKQFAFMRAFQNEKTAIVFNCDFNNATLNLKLQQNGCDLLTAENINLSNVEMKQNSMRIIRF
jgi:glycosidase